MKKTFIIFSFFTFSFSLTYAQTWLWGADGTGSIKANDYGGNVATDRLGNAYMTSDYYGTITFSPYTLNSPNGSVYLVKYNSAGVAQWATQSVSQSIQSYAFSTSVATSTRGMVYITGYFDDTVSFGSYTLSRKQVFSGYGDVFLVKYDGNSNVIWAKQSNSASVYSGAMPYSVATDGRGNVFVTGYFTDTISFGAYTLKSGQSYAYNVFLVKYDSSGNVLWARQSNIPSIYSSGTAYSVSADRLGNAYITGYFGDSISFGSTQLVGPNYSSSVFLAKYDANGNVLWAKQSYIPSYRSYGSASAVTADINGNAYLAGSFKDTLTFGSYMLKTNNSYSYSATEIFLVKYDANGNVLWAEQSDCKALRYVYSNTPHLSSDENENLYMTFDGDSTFSFGGNTFNIPNYNNTVCLAELNDSGRVLCSSMISESANYITTNNGVASDPAGKYIYMAGSMFNDTLVFGPDVLIAGSGSEQPYLARWQPCDSNVCTIAASVWGTNDICSGSSAFLSASGGGSYLWSDGETSSAISVAPHSNTTYTVTVSNGSCSAQKSISVTVHPGPVVTACCDSSILPGQSVSLRATGGVSYLWNPPTGLSCDTCSNPIAAPSQTTTYTLLVTTDSGCSVTDVITIDVNCGQVFIPTAFSPNNDGQNDVLRIYGSCISKMDFVLFDRWGNKVFESTNINEGWDGTYQGKPMNSGTYVYYFNAVMDDASLITRHGNITLVR